MGMRGLRQISDVTFEQPNKARLKANKFKGIWRFGVRLGLVGYLTTFYDYRLEFGRNPELCQLNRVNVLAL